MARTAVFGARTVRRGRAFLIGRVEHARRGAVALVFDRWSAARKRWVRVGVRAAHVRHGQFRLRLRGVVRRGGWRVHAESRGAAGARSTTSGYCAFRVI
jgi:hypothetical protein